MTPKEQDEFYTQNGAGVHTDPSRFQAIANVCLGKVLDIACGTGDLADYYDGYYTGFDQSDVAIKMAKSVPRENASFFTDDAFHYLDTLDSRWDTAVMAEFIEHLDNWAEYCLKLISKMRDGSRIVISVPNGNRIPDKDHKVEFTVPMLRKYFSEYGSVTFHNYDGFSGRILMTLDIGVKVTKKLSLGMFVKNEAKGLETAILSCINFVDEIVILVDSKTDDKTLEIAKLYGEVAKNFDWEDSFSKARNLVQSFITLPWVLILDGHEFVDQTLDLDKALEWKGDGLMTKIRLEGGFEFDFPRIIRKEVQWEFDVHNNAMVKKPKMYSEFVIQHDRDNFQTQEAADIRAKQRTTMIQEKMFADIKKNKKDPRPYFYLGELFFSLKEYKKAMKYWKKYLKYSEVEQERWLVCFNIAGCYSQRSLYPLVFRWLKKAEKELPGRWEVEKAMGVNYLFLNDYESAVTHLTLSLGGPTERVVYSPWPFDLFDTWEKIATCYRRLNKPHEALVALKRALKNTKSSKNIKNIEQRVKVMKEFMEV